MQSRQQGKGSEERDKSFAAAGNLVLEALSSMRTIQSYTLQNRISEQFRYALIEPTEVAIVQDILGGFWTAFAQLSTFLVFSFAWYIGGVYIKNDLLNFQQLTRAYFAIVLASRGLWVHVQINDRFRKLIIFVWTTAGSGMASAQAADIAKARGSLMNILKIFREGDKVTFGTRKSFKRLPEELSTKGE